MSKCLVLVTFLALFSACTVPTPTPELPEPRLATPIVTPTSDIRATVNSERLQLPPTAAPTLAPARDAFYVKMLDAAGIPIGGSGAVLDEAMTAAQLIVERMLEARPDIREAMIERGAHVAVMATTEVTTDIPEHAFLKDDQNTDWDQRARGLGGTLAVPTTSGAEENILCLGNDPYQGESILIHEFSHAVKLVGLPFVADGPELLARLDTAYELGLAEGRWAGTYAATNVEEYWAEGVQSWFNANANASPPDGIHNHVDNRAALQDYDPELASIMSAVFSIWTYTCPGR